MMKLPNKIKKTIVSLMFGLVVLGMFLSVRTYYRALENDGEAKYLAMASELPYDTDNLLYLSDYDYIEERSYVENGYYFRKDKNNGSGLITVNLDLDEDGKNEAKTFIKGVSAWATSDIIYDVSNLPYDYFEAYVGVDAAQTSTYYNSGVYFTIFTSMDGEVWQTAYSSQLKKGWDKADYVKISLYNKENEDADDSAKTKIKYLRLYANENGDSWYSHWHDDAVYADAKFVKEGYVSEFKEYPIISKVSEYTKEINEYKDDIAKGDFSNLEEYDLTILKKEFVERIGYDILQALFNYSEDYRNIVEELFQDKDTLELYLLGGKPDGNYVTSLRLLKDLFNEYREDFALPEDGDLYKEMAITLSLTHSANVGTWISGAPEDPDDPNGSNALDRYLIFKKLYKAGKLDNDIFKNLSVEEMRFIMNNIIDDEEIIWLNDYTRVNNSKNPYTYINYQFGYDYTLDKYYDPARESEWNNKKHGKLEYGYHFSDGEYFKDTQNFIRSDYNITYQKGYPKLWIVFEEGSVCGGLSKTGSNIQGSYGIPSSVVSQPGHAAYIYMALKNGEKYWELYNDVSGWGLSGKTEKLSVRMPNGWGDGSYVGSYPASYILLAQAALNDLDNYNKAEKILMTVDAFSDNSIKEAIYEAALEVQDINFDAWLGLINVYADKGASDVDFYSLAERIVSKLKHYPLPMDDLLKLIQSKMKTDTYKVNIANLIEATLTEVKSLPDSEYIQAGAARQVATYLLDSHEVMATFSFDGEEADTIKLNDKIISKGAVWQYSLDSLRWSDKVEGLTHKLDADEVNMIHEETEILVKITGDNESVYEVEIERARLAPEISYSDRDNTINIDVENGNNKKNGYKKDAVEWKLATDGDDAWQKISEVEPKLEGNKNIEIRVGRHDNFLASEPMTLEFTAIGESDEYLYVNASKLNVYKVSSEEKGRSENQDANNVLDDDLGTVWHTYWDGSDHDRYIVLGMDEPTLISALEYIPRQSSTNGIVTKAEVYVSMTGEDDDWTLVEASNSLDWAVNKNAKYAVFKEPVLTKYVKLVGVECAGDGRSFMSAASINLFENASARTIPTAEVEYSTMEETTGSVTATLVKASKNITITNNHGSDIYVFDKNGSFTFEFVDDYGNKGEVTATVTWIKEKSSETPSDPGFEEPGFDEPGIEDPGKEEEKTPSEPEQDKNTQEDNNNNDQSNSNNNNSNSSNNSSSNNNSSSKPNSNGNSSNNSSNSNNNNYYEEENNSNNNNFQDDDNSNGEYYPNADNNEDGIINKGTTKAKKMQEALNRDYENNQDNANVWLSPKMIALYVVGSLVLATSIILIITYNNGTKKYKYHK